MKQMLLFPDPQPLVERLGAEFFRSAPACPGVYLMRDAIDTVLYVGKAKNLRKRLGSYRVANPDRLKRRQLRLLRAVARIQLLACDSESSALARESELLKNIRPKFNRAGTWPATLRFLIWRVLDGRVEIAVSDTVPLSWEFFGPLGSKVLTLRNVLARLVWRVGNPDLPVSTMPTGWWQGRFENHTSIVVGSAGHKIKELLSQILSAAPQSALEWVAGTVKEAMSGFDKAAIAADLEWLVADAEKRTGNRT